MPGAELTLHASVHSAPVSERAMLVEALDALGPEDALWLDRGYPASWLVNLLNARGIRFVMRCDTVSGVAWRSVRQFLRSQQPEVSITLSAPNGHDAADWECAAVPPQVRVVRQLSPQGQIRVLITNLTAE